MIQRSLLDQLDELGQKGGLLILDLSLSWRDKDGILVNVAMITVMSGVGDLPRVERHHKKRVNCPTNKVIQSGVLREGAMTTFVTNDPHSGSNTALNKAIQDPGASAEKWRWEIINLES